jgi:hypothetical protein
MAEAGPSREPGREPERLACLGRLRRRDIAAGRRPPRPARAPAGPATGGCRARRPPAAARWCWRSPASRAAAPRPGPPIAAGRRPRAAPHRAASQPSARRAHRCRSARERPTMRTRRAGTAAPPRATIGAPGRRRCAGAGRSTLDPGRCRRPGWSAAQIRARLHHVGPGREAQTRRRSKTRETRAGTAQRADDVETPRRRREWLWPAGRARWPSRYGKGWRAPGGASTKYHQRT